MSVRPAMTPHMLRPLHLPNAPVSRRAGASHACASGQYSCSRYPLRKACTCKLSELARIIPGPHTTDLPE